MSAEHRRGLLIPPTYNQDPKILKLSGSARALFVSILVLAVQLPTKGRLSRSQVFSCGTGLRNVGRYVDQLVSVGLLRCEDGGGFYVVADPDTWVTPGRSVSTYRAPNGDPLRTYRALNGDPLRTYGAPNGHLSRTYGAPIAHLSENGTAGQSTEEAPRAGPSARPGAGSFEVPSSSRTDGTPKDVRDAPRSGARPARKTDPIDEVEIPAEGVTLPGAEARNLIRKQIANGQKINPASTGRPTKFSKYDPDRPIKPITSALFREADPE